MLKAGAALASLIGLDIRRFICDKKVSSSNGDESPMNPNLHHHLPEIHVISDDINDPTLPHDSSHYAKHATYHGTTKHSFRPTLNQALVGYTNIVTSLENYPHENDFSNRDSSYINNTAPYLASGENRRKSSTTSTDSSDILPHPDSTPLTCILPRSQRRTSSTSSINSSSINPSFDPGDEDYYNVINPRVIPPQNKKPNANVLRRPATLNLQFSHSRNQCNCHRSSSCSSSTPSPSHYNVGQNPNLRSPNTPSDAFSPQRVVPRFKRKDTTNPYHTLLDLPAEGQSQDGTVPLTALFSQLEMEQAKLKSCDDASFMDCSDKLSNQRRISNKSDEINT